MEPWLVVLLICLTSVVAGTMGSLLGLGGGVLIVPVLTLAFGVDVRLAIGASIVAVVATSVSASPRYLTSGLANLRVAVTLGVATVSGAILGALVAGHVGTRVLFAVFGIALGLSALQMLRGRHDRSAEHLPADRLADGLGLHDLVEDGRLTTYGVTRTGTGLSLMVVAGAVSGLLGIGSGALKVPAMDLAMRLPIKVSTATSNLMIGVTGAASALVYLQRGDIVPALAGAVAIGTVAGARIGSRLLPVLPAAALRRVFVVVLLVIAAQMLVKGLT